MSDRDESSRARQRELIRSARSEAQQIVAALAGVEGRAPQPLSLSPDSFAGYEIVSERHRGAQGIVYQAVHKATRRNVAIKVMREGPFVDARDVARFEREVRILAQLQHPNIVAIHDRGETAGHVFFVMDFIAGRPLITNRQDGERPVQEILPVFAAVCDAVNAAHLRGVIHRDLKPGNILVDARGEPHVLDFGLAKVAGAPNADGRDPVSVSGQFVGSLPWASPEQAEGRPEKIDLRTDVYSLGVILYQMLTGRFPYDVGGPLREVLDRITEAEPIPPSSVRRGINDELETIVLKCLQKDPDRRYQTAGELLREISRFRAGEPIEAKRDSGWYVLGKFMQRHKAAAAVAIGYVLVITAAALGLLVSYRAAESQRIVAAEKSRVATEAAHFVASMGEFSVLESATDPFSPEVPSGYDLELLERLALWLEHEVPDMPEAEAGLRTTIGLGYLKLRAYDEAETHLARALAIRERGGADPRDLADSLHNLGRALYFNAKYGRAEASYARAVDIRQRLFGEPNLDVANSYNDLAACLAQRGELVEAERLLRQALDMRLRLLAKDDPWVVASQNNLAACLKTQARYPEALELFRIAHDWIVARDVNVLFVVRTLRSIADCLASSGRYEEAIGYIRGAQERVRILPGDHRAELARCEYLLARCQHGLGNLREAERLCRGAVETQRQGESPRLTAPTSDSMLLLGRVLADAGNPVQAEPWLREALRLRKKVFAEEHWMVGEAKSFLGACLVALGRRGEGESLLGDGHRALEGQLGEDDPRVQAALERRLVNPPG